MGSIKAKACSPEQSMHHDTGNLVFGTQKRSGYRGSTSGAAHIPHAELRARYLAGVCQFCGSDSRQKKHS